MHQLPANEHTVVLIEVPAPVDACYEVIVDLEAYPEWVQGISAAQVEARDDLGRPARARFEAVGIGRRSVYVLDYDLSDAPRRVSWTLVEGDITSRLDGTYTFEPSASAEDGAVLTDVTYELNIDLSVPLPGYVKRRAEDKIVEAALRRFHDRVVSTLR